MKRNKTSKDQQKIKKEKDLLCVYVLYELELKLSSLRLRFE